MSFCDTISLPAFSCSSRKNELLYHSMTSSADLIQKIDVQIFRTVAEIPTEVWTKIMHKANFLTQPSYLSLIERLHADQLNFYYSVCYLEKELVGFFFFQENTFKGENLLDYFPDTQTGSALKRFGAKALSIFKPLVKSINLPMLNAGNIFMTGEAGCFCIYEKDKSARFALQIKCIHQIQAQFPHIKTVLNADFYAKDEENTMPFVAEHYHRIEIEADNIMSVPSTWQNFDDYLAALSSKYRVRAKKILKLSEEVTRKVLSTEEVLAEKENINFLYNQVADKVSFKLATLHPDFFYEQKKTSPENYLMEGYYLEGKMIGFISLYLLAESAEIHYFGMDYSVMKDYHLYQRMLYDVVGIAILERKKEVHFGRTAPEVKTTIGASVKPMFGYLKHSNPIFNYLMRFFIQRLKPREYVLRNPFK